MEHKKTLYESAESIYFETFMKTSVLLYGLLKRNVDLLKGDQHDLLQVWAKILFYKWAATWQNQQS